MSGRLKMEKHLPALDGLRGVAILLVLVFHVCEAPLSSTSNPMGRALIHVASMGWTGVDLFFVLSGFLITRILLDAKSADNYFKVFYTRRVLRIFPIYYLSLIAIFWIWVPLSMRVSFFRLHSMGSFKATEQLWYWFNLVNLRTAYYPMLIPAITHYWTLSIEEQFYAVWPAVVYFVRERWLVVVSVTGIVLALVLRNLPAVQAVNGVHNNFIYRFTPFRVDTLLFGALLAVVVKHVSGRAVLVASAVGFSVMTVVLLLWASGDAARGRFTFTGLAILYTSLLGLCLSSEAVGAIFKLRVLRTMGKYSYAVYLLHPTIVMWTNLSMGHLLHEKPLWPGHAYGSQVMFGVVDLGMCFLVARISWVLIEAPVLKLKRYFRYSEGERSRPSAAAVAAAVAAN